VIPAPFDYLRAESTDAAVAALAEHGPDAKLLAGGQSLIPLMRFRLATPAVLVDVSELAELSYIRDDGEQVAIGAMTRHGELEHSELLAREVPILAHVAGLVGDPSVRHRGTLGGSLAHGDPASDLPAVVLALGAELVVQGPAGRREVPATGFFTGFLETALAADEVLVEVRVPKVPTAGWSYQKFNRRALDWAIVGVAAVRNGTTGVALVNMGPTPLRAAAVEAALAQGASAAEAAAVAGEGTDPPSDLNGDPGYRRHLARVLVERALNEASP
jgi:carbon-monoxide dehydrogenase medium subunit